MVTIILVAANIAAAFLLVWQPDLAYEFGFRSGTASPLTIFVSLFLHANLLHLLGNMLFLVCVGGSLELATGPLRFLAAYFLGGLAGELAHWLAMRSVSSPEPLIGASACIASCIGYYALRYASLKVPLGPKVTTPIWVLALVWAFAQALGAFLHIGDQSGVVSYWSHLGGLIAGAVLSLFLRSPDVGQEKLDREVLADIGLRSPAARVMAARRHLVRHPKDLATWHKLADALRTLGEEDELAEALEGLYWLEPEVSRLEIVRELADLGRLKVLSSEERLGWARQLLTEEHGLALRVLESLPDDPEALFLLGELFWDDDRKLARTYLDRLASRWVDHPATRRAKARGWIALDS